MRHKNRSTESASIRDHESYWFGHWGNRSKEAKIEFPRNGISNRNLRLFQKKVLDIGCLKARFWQEYHSLPIGMPRDRREVKTEAFRLKLLKERYPELKDYFKLRFR